MARNHRDDTTPPLMPGRLVRAGSRLAAIPVVAFLVLWSGGAFLMSREASRAGFDGLAVIMPIGMGVFGLIVMAVFVVGLIRGGNAVADAMDHGARHARRPPPWAGPPGPPLPPSATQPDAPPPAPSTPCEYCGGPVPARAPRCDGCGARPRAAGHA